MSHIQNVVDKNQRRLDAGLVVLFIGAYLFSTNEFFIYILVYDYLVRVYMMPFLSPIYLISTVLVKFLNLKERVSDDLEKEFASHVGLTILFSILIADLLSETTVALLLSSLFFLWKIAEVAKDFCIASKFHRLLKNKNIELESL